MTTWNSNPYPPPPQDPNQHYYGGQGGYPQQPYPGAGYPNASAPSGSYGSAPYSGQPGGPSYGQSGGTPYGYPSGTTYDQPGGGPYAQPGGGYTQTDMYGTTYGEDPDVKGFDFSDQSIRRGFIRKVYSILMVQLLITAGVIALFMFHKGTKRFVAQNSWLFFVALGVLLVAMIALACCGEVRRKAPANYILLGLFTAAEAFLLGVASSKYGVDEVLMAVGITTVLCLGLTLFAFQTRIDFTVCGGFLFIAVILLLVFGIIAGIMGATGNSNRIVNLVYASLGALLFSVYLIYDTQLMMGGKHKYSISPEEYIFAALNLYVDIITIFIYILSIIGLVKN